MYMKLQLTKGLVNGFVFLDKDKKMLGVTYSNLVYSNATSQNSESSFNAMFKSTGVSGTYPLTNQLPLTHIVDISNFINDLFYIRVIGSGTSDTWGGILNLTYSKDDGVNYSSIDECVNYQMKASAFDTVEFDVSKYVRVKKMVIKNESQNEHYSLSDKTLIHLPDASNKNMILFGMKQGEEISLNVPFTKQNYVNDTPVGKVFSQSIESGDTLHVKEIEKNYVPIYTWHETKMTSDTTPLPFVASASSFYSISTYSLPPWKAFDGNNTSDSASNSASTWATAENAHINSWIKLDFGVDKDVNIVQLTPRISTWLTQTPKEFYIESSTNDVDWIEIGRFDISNWQSLTPQVLLLNKTKARYFRITHLSNNGANYAAWNEIKYGYKREVN